MEPRKKLFDILQLNSERENLQRAWEKTEAASDFAPLPAGEYTCRVLSGELFNAKKGTPGYKLTFEVTEGDYADRRIWHDLELTAQALPMSKRDLAKLGVSRLEQLEKPLPPGILVKVKLTLRKDDDGNDFNKVKSFEASGIEKGDAFAPTEETGSDTSFDPAALERGDSSEKSSATNQGQQSSPLKMKAVETNGPYGGERR